MPQMIGIFLRYLSVTLTLNGNYKSILKLLKTDFYVFAFFTKFLVMNISINISLDVKLNFMLMLIQVARLLYMFVVNFAF
jgi:hypothetical protein